MQLLTGSLEIGVASSRKSPGCFKNVIIMEATVHLGTFCTAEIFFVAFPRSVSQHNPVSDFFNLMAFALICIGSCETRCAPFQNMSN